jgi:putative ABC transport system permease protein
MMTFLKVAWRNIWRNKRRTILTAASILLAVFLALVMQSVQKGTFGHMTDNIVQAYSGYIQVHKKGYWDDKDLNNSFRLTDTLASKLGSEANVESLIPRIESFALASNGMKTKVVMVTGIQPGVEERLTELDRKVVNGRYLVPGDSGILLGQGVADYLGLKLNDTLVLIGQGYHGVSAAGKFPVKGILHMNSPDLENQVVFMALSTARDFYSCEGNVTSLVLNLKNNDLVRETLVATKKNLDLSEYEVMSWREMLAEFVQYVDSKNASNLILQGILYMIVGFGIFGTILMMTAERIKEFGVMIAVGMRKMRLVTIILMESVFLGLVGVVAGMILSLPVIFYYVFNPVHMTGAMGNAYKSYGFEPLLCMSPPGLYFLYNSMLVLVIVLVASIYPMRKIMKMNVINALRNKL